jgi:RNA polymerase-binding transcription factor DksA
MKSNRFSNKEISFFKKKLREGIEESSEELKSLNGLLADQKEYIKQSGIQYDADASKVRNREILKDMRRRTKSKLNDYKKAIKKINKGIYGLCEESGKKISKQRLMAMPHATTRIKIN